VEKESKAVKKLLETGEFYKEMDRDAKNPRKLTRIEMFIGKNENE
jgi:hypothetical protein